MQEPDEAISCGEISICPEFTNKNSRNSHSRKRILAWQLLDLFFEQLDFKRGREVSFMVAAVEAAATSNHSFVF
jgi:hypothetical protein